MRIKLLEIEGWEREVFEPLHDGHELVYLDQPLSADTVSELKDAEVISPFIYSKLDAEVLEQLPALRLIASRSTGVDHIDLEYCRDHEITVCNVPSYGDNTVAEHVFALLLAISHRLIDAVDRTRKGDFTSEGLQGFDLLGKTLGVIGTGSIGRYVIQIAKGFGMEVLASDPKPDEAYAGKTGFDYVPMQELLARSDIVTVHVPGSDATRHLLGADEFAAMKSGAVLINTSRGTVVDVHALLQSLVDGRLRAAGLDVLPEEPVIREEAELLRAVFTRQHDLSRLLADHVLLHMRNVVITPHSAFNTREAVLRILDTTRENITAFADGKPRNTVAG